MFEPITVGQMIEVDRLMIEQVGISLLQMMENAGRGLAAVARHRLGGDLADRRVVVLVGPGNNGGGGLVAARHLANADAWVAVALTGNPLALGAAPEHQRRVLARLAVPGSARPTGADDLPGLLADADLVIDALIGYRRAAPRTTDRRLHPGRECRRPPAGAGPPIRPRRGPRHRRRAGHPRRGDRHPGLAQGRPPRAGGAAVRRRALPGRHQRAGRRLPGGRRRAGRALRARTGRARPARRRRLGGHAVPGRRGMTSSHRGRSARWRRRRVGPPVSPPCRARVCCPSCQAIPYGERDPGAARSCCPVRA
jgi:NAD(P)H-hydrate repair Nnr-like enzyme with NAD(P)H-hydrate epimerase domain